MAASKSTQAEAKAPATPPAAQQPPEPPPQTSQDASPPQRDDDDDGLAAVYPPGATEPAEPMPDAAPRWALVIDTTAQRRPREHKVGNAKYRFQPGVETRMPIEDGLRLVNIETFSVRDEFGNIYRPAKTEIVPGSAELELRNDQVIATLYELQIGALRDRAKHWEEHDDYDPRMPRDDLIRFMMDRLSEGPPRARGPRSTNRRASADPWDFTGNPDGQAGPVSQAEIAAALRAQSETAALTARISGGYGGYGSI